MELVEDMSDQENQITLRERVFDEKALTEFISEQIDKFRNHAKLIGDPECVNLTDLNRALAEYSLIESALISLLAMARIETRKHTENFENWFSEKYIIIRNRENRPDLTAQKWLGQKEIERIIRIEFAFEFKGLQDRKDLSEMKESFIGRMLSAWNNHQFILNQISKNLQTQVSINNTGLSRDLE